MADKREKPQSASFGAHVFGRRQIQQYCTKKCRCAWLSAIDGQGKIGKEDLDQIAKVLQEWAVKNGATHYTHWFQPLRGAGAEKHDAFLSWSISQSEVLEHLSGRELLQGETDASSFPTGGLSTTSAARGYTIWDPTTPPFLLENGNGLTLCLPALFISYAGHALDYRTPLLRSEQKLNQAALRLLRLFGIKAQQVFPTLGPEQEYFIVDRQRYFKRPDLLTCGRTVFGAPPAKGQELEDHYFSAVEPRIMRFMRDFENAALLLGIPIKTRHNEVAPAQHEMAPLFEKSILAADHNQLVMDLMRHKAEAHELACLFHEKPFNKLNGSGKHCNWSLATDTGQNLLDPRGSSITFLVLLTAVLRSVHEHALLLRASVGSFSNDWRLGAAEAPPSIVSIFLGEPLERLLEDLIHHRKTAPARLHAIDLGLKQIPPILPDVTDRNRTSFFAFTGNKFELRAAGASQNIAWPIAILNAIVADSLELLLDEIEDGISRQPKKDIAAAAFPILAKHLKAAENIIFSGDCYSAEWEKEAERRKLPNIRKSFHAFAIFEDPKTGRVLNGVLSPEELRGRLEAMREQYAKEANIECTLMIDLFRTRILPAATQHQKTWAKSADLIHELKMATGEQRKSLALFSEEIEQAIQSVDELEKAKIEAQGLGWDAQGVVFCEIVLPKMEKAREAVDRLEGRVPDSLWPLPKYQELLYYL